MLHALQRRRFGGWILGLIWLAACAEGAHDHTSRAAPINAGSGKDAGLPNASGSVAVLEDGGPGIREDTDATLLDAGALDAGLDAAALDGSVVDAAVVADGAVPDAMPLPMSAIDSSVIGGIGGIGGAGGVGGSGGVGAFGGI